MRELTVKEIENAPDWCDKHIILANEMFYTDGETQTTGNGCRTHPLFFANDERLKPIPRKEFDVKEELTSLLQLCVNDMYSPSGKIKKKTARKLMAACEKGLVNYPD